MKINLDVVNPKFGKFVIINTIQALIIVFCVGIYSYQVKNWIDRDSYCRGLAFDYCAYYSAGLVANEVGIEKVYDLQVLGEVERAITLNDGSGSETFLTNPVPYLPVFLLFFKPLAWLDLRTSYWFWVVLNMLLLLTYLFFFIRRMISKNPPIFLLLLIFTSYPVFLNFALGQVNVLLVVFVCELIRAISNKRTGWAGFWLACLLLKPQILPLILVALIAWRNWPVLKSFFVFSLVIFLSSTFLVGIEGWKSWIDLMLGYSKGITTNSPELMMNWRMIGWHLVQNNYLFLSRFVVILGTVVTFLFTMISFRNEPNSENEYLVISSLGLFASTGLVTWHSHTPTIMVLLPFVLLLTIKKMLPTFITSLFVLIPFLSFCAIIAINYFGTIVGLSVEAIEEIPQIIFGFQGFILNIIGLGWAIWRVGTTGIPQSVQRELK